MLCNAWLVVKTAILSATLARLRTVDLVAPSDAASVVNAATAAAAAADGAPLSFTALSAAAAAAAMTAAALSLRCAALPSPAALLRFKHVALGTVKHKVSVNTYDG